MSEQSVKEKLYAIISDKLAISRGLIHDYSSFVTLGADDLDIVEIVMECEKAFGIRVADNEVNRIRTVADVLSIIERRMSLSHSQQEPLLSGAPFVGSISTPQDSDYNDDCKLYDELISEGHFAEAIRIGRKWVERSYYPFYLKTTVLYYRIKDYSSLVEFGMEGLERIKKYSLDNNTNELLTDFHKISYYISLAQDALNNIRQARRGAFYGAHFTSSELMTDEGISIKEDSKVRFERIEREYTSHFLEFPYRERKILVPVKSYNLLNQQSLSVIRIDSLPHIFFKPMGDPIAGQLYVGHPYCPDVYIPFDSYQLELIEDKLREFCYIAQCLGATKITVEAVNASTADNRSSYDKNMVAAGDYKMVNGSASVQKQGTYHLLEEISKSIELYQEYIPIAHPYLPTDLVWYPHEPSWQRFYTQRMNGQTVHKERIETRKTQVVEGSELQAIKGEFKALVVAAKGEWTENLEEKFIQQENAILSINVEFAPLLPSSNEETLITPSEQEYLDEVQFTLEDGAIGPRERKTLERARVRLGLSETRAAEIEASVALPNLTNEEKEYLEEVKAVLEDGEIGPRERKSLERARTRLGISEKRAKEIEKL